MDALYPSERRFLAWLAGSARTVLDVGCAAGGLADVWCSFNQDIEYTGVDVSRALIEAARLRRPQHRFLVEDCIDGVSLPDGAADVVQALGWLHWEPRWRIALPELWRLTGERLFFDIRLRAGIGDDIVGVQRIAGGGTAPYVVVAWEELARELRSLAPARILAFGYEGRPAETAVGVPPTVTFAAFVLEKGQTPASACLELPLEWPEAFDGVERIDADLTSIIPSG